MSDFLRTYDLVIFPISVFAVVSAHKSWMSEWMGIAVIDSVSLGLGIVGLIVSTAYLSRRSA